MRKRYRLEDREEFVEEVRAGASVREVAARLGLSPSIGYRWMRMAGRRPPKLARIMSASAAARAAITIQVGGATVRVEPGFDRELLAAVISALSSRAK